jgi:serine protease Do
MPESDGMIEDLLGLQVIPITPRIAAQLGVPSDTQGLAITAVDPNSDAARKGLQRGTIILQAQGDPIASVADLEAVLSAARASDRAAVLLRVRPRGAGMAASVAVRLRTED